MSELPLKAIDQFELVTSFKQCKNIVQEHTFETQFIAGIDAGRGADVAAGCLFARKRYMP